MATKKKMLQAAAGSATGGAGLDITEVFSTYLYEGNGSTQTITNGIDLDGEGGLVWTQVRNVSGGNRLVDSENGNNYLRTHSTSGLTDIGSPAFTLNSDGFTAPNGATAWNESGNDYASWAFRKAPKFFDVVTWTGDGTNPRTINHDLDAEVGMMVIKRLDTTSNWHLYHRSWSGYGEMNLSAAFSTYAGLWPSAPTSTTFTLDNNAVTNASGGTYVAYLFAHNDGDGDFGGEADADIIKCGSYTGNESSFPTVDLGFEPQFILLKSATSTENWHLIDTMRGWLADGTNSSGDFKYLWANASNSEGGGFGVNVTSTGFELTSANAEANSNGNTFIYMAIRRGPLAQPESGTEVFAMDTLGSTTPNPPSYNAGFPVDLGIMKSKTSGTDPWRVGARLTGEKQLRTNATDAEITDTQHKFDYQDGWYDAGSYVDSQYQSWQWKRAPGFFDVVSYSGTGSARTVSHNLGVAPEMMWVKSRTSGTASYQWWVYHKDLGNNKALNLNQTYASQTFASMWNSTTPTQNEFSLGGDTGVNWFSNDYISYHFATVPGVSKVGSYTGNGTSQTIDCGFTSGARFVLLKNASSIDDWRVFDTARGIVAGNDPMLYLNSTEAEETGGDYIDPQNSGFSLTSNSSVNASGDTYIFYAIA